jgi:hypothetical protein
MCYVSCVCALFKHKGGNERTYIQWLICWAWWRHQDGLCLCTSAALPVLACTAECTPRTALRTHNMRAHTMRKHKQESTPHEHTQREYTRWDKQTNANSARGDTCAQTGVFMRVEDIWRALIHWLHYRPCAAYWITSWWRVFSRGGISSSWLSMVSVCGSSAISCS